MDPLMLKIAFCDDETQERPDGWKLCWKNMLLTAGRTLPIRLIKARSS